MDERTKKKKIQLEHHDRVKTSMLEM